MKRFIKTILFLTIGMFSASAQGQQNVRISDKSFFSYPDAQFVRQQPVKSEGLVSESFQHEASPLSDPADTMSIALYRSKVKQHGWVRGRGLPITEETASHLSTYYRFSKKNKAGHWTKMECLDAFGHPKSCGSTYLINPNDDDDKQLDENWRDKLKEIVYWEFVGDNTGENCVQENAYNKDGELILSYTPVRVGDNKYMGHYVDAWGLPAKMRNEQGAKYVLVQWDENGYECDVSFIGDDGFFKRNNWGAYRSKYYYDKDGFLMQHMSVNVDGEYMLDRAGNSGMRETHDEWGLTTSATNLDEYGKVIRVALSKTVDEDFIRRNYENDKWGRDTCEWFSLADGVTPDTITGGVHAERYKYDDHGNWVLIQRLGIDGKPINGRKGYSMVRRKFDEHGNMIFYECRNAKGDFFNNSLCLSFYKYDEKDILIYCKQYETTNGSDTVCVYSFHCDGNRKIYDYPESDTRIIYIYDGEGNEIERLLCTLDGVLKENREGYSRFTRKIIQELGRKVIEECYFNKDGQYSDLSHLSYNRRITICDSINNIITYQHYDNNSLLSTYQKRMAKGIEESGELAQDFMGEQARSHSTDGLYFDLINVKSINGKTSYTEAINEYGETCYYMRSDNNSPYVYAFNSYGESYYMDEKGMTIRSYEMKNFRDTLPSAEIIEIYDSVAVQLGIKSGDIIMEYGNWKYPELRKSTYYDYSLRETTFDLRDQKKRMVVMRRNPDTNQAEVKEIMLDKGTLGDFGFYFYRIYSTQKEKARYDEAYKTWLASQPATKQKKEKKLKVNTYRTHFMRPLRSNGNHKNIYNRGTIDDAIVLALAVQDKKGHVHTFHHTDSVEVFDSCRFVKDRTSQKIWFTTDMRTVRSLDLTGKYSYWDAYFWYDTKDKRISKPCKPLYREAGVQMEQYVNQLQTVYKDSMQALYEEAWKAVEDDSVIVRFAKVNADDGYMVRHGYKDRLFIILEWCDWTCIDAPDSFSPVLKQYLYEPKHVVLLSVETNDDIYLYNDIVEIHSDNSMMGAEIRGKKLSYKYVKENILDKYKEWKSGKGYRLPLQHNDDNVASL